MTAGFFSHSAYKCHGFFRFFSGGLLIQLSFFQDLDDFFIDKSPVFPFISRRTLKLSWLHALPLDVWEPSHGRHDLPLSVVPRDATHLLLRHQRPRICRMMYDQRSMYEPPLPRTAQQLISPSTKPPFPIPILLQTLLPLLF